MALHCTRLLIPVFRLLLLGSDVSTAKMLSPKSSLADQQAVLAFCDNPQLILIALPQEVFCFLPLCKSASSAATCGGYRDWSGISSCKPLR